MKKETEKMMKDVTHNLGLVAAECFLQAVIPKITIAVSEPDADVFQRVFVATTMNPADTIELLQSAIFTIKDKHDIK
jgi:hypothetical protein